MACHRAIPVQSGCREDSRQARSRTQANDQTSRIPFHSDHNAPPTRRSPKVLSKASANSGAIKELKEKILAHFGVRQPVSRQPVFRQEQAAQDRRQHIRRLSCNYLPADSLPTPCRLPADSLPTPCRSKPSDQNSRRPHLPLIRHGPSQT